MILRRDLGCFAEEWRGWTVNRGDLVSPDGWCVDRHMALSVPLMHGQINALRHDLKQTKTDLEELQRLRDTLQEQPAPGECPDYVPLAR
jgi:hypothetical protein